jgi:hypothetical protein
VLRKAAEANANEVSEESKICLICKKPREQTDGQNRQMRKIAPTAHDETGRTDRGRTTTTKRATGRTTGRADGLRRTTPMMG